MKFFHPQLFLSVCRLDGYSITTPLKTSHNTLIGTPRHACTLVPHAKKDQELLQVIAKQNKAYFMSFPLASTNELTAT